MGDETGWRAGSKNVRESQFGATRVFGQDTAEVYKFGPFRLEPAERKLSRNNEPVVLTPKAFETLVLLVRNSGHLLDKDELIKTLWPESFVEEGNLSNNIFVLRKALGEDHQYIETIPKRGYRFVGAIRELPNPVSGSLERTWGQSPELADEINAPRPLGGVVDPPFTREGWARPMFVLVALTGFALLVIASLWVRRPAALPDRSRWVQLTNFADSVTQPAVSADGRMLAFIRGYSTWIGPGKFTSKCCRTENRCS
jgi:DNA-binding winged helix-turn-helix (wHTH) protein